MRARAHTQTLTNTLTNLVVSRDVLFNSDYSCVSSYPISRLNFLSICFLVNICQQNNEWWGLVRNKDQHRLFQWDLIFKFACISFFLNTKDIRKYLLDHTVEKNYLFCFLFNTKYIFYFIIIKFQKQTKKYWYK